MGTWGSGNFDNDDADDYLGSITSQLVGKIKESFESEMGYDLDEGGEGKLMPSVAILVALCQHCNGEPPEVDEVRKWRERYLEIYDDQIDDLASNADFKVERRNVIETTFNQLEELARKYWS